MEYLIFKSSFFFLGITLSTPAFAEQPTKVPLKPRSHVQVITEHESQKIIPVKNIENAELPDTALRVDGSIFFKDPKIPFPVAEEFLSDLFFPEIVEI